MGHTSTRRGLFKKFHGKCHYCDRPLQWGKGFSNSATIDHIIPRARGGSYVKSNLVLACFRCNNLRGDMSYGGFLRLVAAGNLPDAPPLSPGSKLKSQATQMRRLGEDDERKF